MQSSLFVQFSAYEGPNRLMGQAAAVAEFASPYRKPMPGAAVEQRLRSLLPAELQEPLTASLTDDPVAFEQLAAHIAHTLHNRHGGSEWPVDVRRTPDGRSQLVAGYIDQQTALHALNVGLRVAHAVFAHGSPAAGNPAMLVQLLRRTEADLMQRQPDPLAQSLMRAAARRNIPVYPVSPGSRVWQYGQGRRSVHFFEVSNDRDAWTGARLAGDKFLTNQLVTRLGFPGVEHHIVHNEAAARAAGEQLGFPLVVKPLDRGNGRGITGDIHDMEELTRAFALAARETRRGVLVERQVPGDSHRLSVFGGRFHFAVRRTPPQIVGNGHDTLATLIDQENERRAIAAAAGELANPLIPDSKMEAVIARQGLSLAHRPAAGQAVHLHTIATGATGATISDCTADVHPDNRDLAEAIVRAFHMDSVGIDFMSPDISRSWREVRCAVIEINGTPGVSTDAKMEIVLEDKFPRGSDGRIPTALLIGGSAELMQRAAERMAQAGLKVGRTDGRETRLGHQRRCDSPMTLPARVLALLLDPGCEALVAQVSPEELERHGLPLDRCDLALICTETALDPALRQLLATHSDRIVADHSSQAALAAVDEAIDALLTRRAPPGSQ